MALVPKLPDISQNSLKIFERELSKAKKENKNQLFPKFSEDTEQKIKYTIEDSEKPYVNMKNLQWLTDLDKDCEDKNRFHEIFMSNYQKMFENEEKEKEKKALIPAFLSRNANTNIKKSLLPISNGKDKLNSSTSSLDLELAIRKPENKTSEHDIRVHLEKIHKKKFEIEDPYLKKLDEFNKLRRLVRKFPFERTDEENNEIYEIIGNIEEFTSLFSPAVKQSKRLIKEYCGYAQLETVSAKNTPVLGNLAFYIILKGTVKPLSVPHVNQYYMKFRTVTPEPKEASPVLGMGQCFGTITELKDRDITTRMFRVMTLEDKCEFLKLSIESFNKISKKIFDEEKLEKLNAIKACPVYSSWPKHTIEELIEIFEWRSFSANTILTSEGYRCPFIGIINKGECHVLRKVDVPYINKKTGDKEKKMKQVVVGKLKENESFGEISVTMKEPMTCTIVTETQCKIGIIPCDKITRLDNITLRLLLQTSNRTFADLNQKQIHEKFIEQEKKKEWKSFKSNVVKNIIDKYGIIPGKGKYITKNSNDLKNPENQ